MSGAGKLRRYRHNDDNEIRIDDEDIKAIHTEDFYQDERILTVKLPRCEMIDVRGFALCTNLTTVSLDNCIGLCDEAFKDCKSLVSINLPMCRTIGVDAFNGCESLMSIELPRCEVIEFGAFMGCSQLTSIRAPICHTIGRCALDRCSQLVEIVLPNIETFNSHISSSYLTTLDLINCHYIGPKAFKGVKGVKTLILNEVRMIDEQAFADMTDLNEVSLPNVECIADGAFMGCYNLMIANISTCFYIGACAFAGCSLSVVWLINCFYIGEHAFHKCTNAIKPFLEYTNGWVHYTNEQAYEVVQRPRLFTLLANHGAAPDYDMIRHAIKECPDRIEPDCPENRVIAELKLNNDDATINKAINNYSLLAYGSHTGLGHNDDYRREWSDWFGQLYVRGRGDKVYLPYFEIPSIYDTSYAYRLLKFVNIGMLVLSNLTEEEPILDFDKLVGRSVSVVICPQVWVHGSHVDWTPDRMTVRGVQLQHSPDPSVVSDYIWTRGVHSKGWTSIADIGELNSPSLLLVPAEDEDRSVALLTKLVVANLIRKPNNPQKSNSVAFALEGIIQDWMKVGLTPLLSFIGRITKAGELMGLGNI